MAGSSAAIVLLVAVAACDRVYGLGDRMEDAAIIDAVPCGAACTTAPAVVHDEDSDCTRDPCDLCPQLDAEVDSDFDGIGDACDFASDQGRPDEAWFEGFDNYDELVALGTWQPVGQHDSLRRNAPDLSTVFMFSNRDSKGVFRLETTLDLPPFLGSGWDAGFVIGANAFDATFDGTFVGLHRSTSLQATMYRIDNSVASQPVTGELIEDSRSLRLVLEVNGSVATLTIRDLVQTVTSTFTIQALPPSSYVGLALRGAIQAEFRYLHHVQPK